MIDLLKIEYAKVKNYNTFWVILAIYAVLVPLTFFGIGQVDFPFLPSDSSLFGFPTIWGFLTWTASWWNILLGVLIVVLVCNDIAFKTQRQNIIDGMSRSQYILGKFYFFILLALAVSLYTFLIGLIFGSVTSNPANMFGGIEAIPIYFVQTLGYFAFAFFWAVLVRKPAISIVLFVVIIMLDDLLLLPLSEFNLSQFFPTVTISDLTPFPFFKELFAMAAAEDPNFEAPFVLSQLMSTILSVVYLLGFVLFGYMSLKRRDL